MDSVDTILNETARQLRETKRPKERKRDWGGRVKDAGHNCIFIIIHSTNIPFSVNEYLNWVVIIHFKHKQYLWIRLLLKPSAICLNRIEMIWRSVLPSTQEGAALVVPATCPGKQEHLTVCDRSSILFLLQQRWAAITSHVPAFTCTATQNTHTFHKNICLWMTLQSASHWNRHTCSQSFHHSLLPHRHMLLCYRYSCVLAIAELSLYL